MSLVHLFNGPNLNLLGLREPEVYGSETLPEIEARCARAAAALDLHIDARQSNQEGELVTWLHEAGAAVRAGGAVGVVLNAGAFTHTSIAIRDAIVGAQVPVVEVHITNVHTREPFRHESFISPVARGTIVGLGVLGYELAIRSLADA